MNASQTASGKYQWWRWPLMPVAAVAGSFIGVAAFMLFGWLSLHVFGGFSNGSWLVRYILPVAAASTAGFLFAFCACNVPPRGGVVSGIVMTTIYAVVKVGWVLSIWLTPGQAMGRTVMELVVGVVAVISAVSYVINFHNESTARQALMSNRTNTSRRNRLPSMD